MYKQVRVPSLNVGGWYDIFTQGTLQNFSAMRASASTPEARQSKLLIGPWSHSTYSSTVGDVDFGFASTLAFINLQTDMTGLTQRWFDYWLKGIDNGVAQEPPIKIFVMGDNVWRDEQEWPLSRTRSTPFYLRRGGRLAAEPPGDELPDQYVYDPSDPTPTLGGSLLMHALFGAGAKDQRPIEVRADILSYATEPLTHDLEVIGPLVVKLWAASDAPDTDFVAQLVDVYPDGFAPIVADGIVRARYRNGDRPELLQPGQPYQFTIDLWATAKVFKAGHRIRIDIASASFPRWDRNPNTGAVFGADAELRPVRQTILHYVAHPSHFVLPIVPR
jgi:putative CocE/NonD family hydrolase